MKIDIEYIRKNNLIILEAIGGSHAYGTNTEKSDVDIRGLYIIPLDILLSGDYVPQVTDDTNDTIFYEVGRYIELLKSSNPNILELTFFDESNIIYKHPLFDKIIEHRDKFITKACKNSIGGYSKTQISKATSLNKKINWEHQKVVRKDILDFCYVMDGDKSFPIKDKLEILKLDQKFCGVTYIPNARDAYALFYDHDAHLCFSERLTEIERELHKAKKREEGGDMGLFYKGIINDNDGKESNSLRLSSIPKGEKALFVFSYNKDGYMQHCKDYKEYQEWLEKRNITRYTEHKDHGQRFDAKNLMHCKRLLLMSREIAEGKGMIVKRPDAEDLLKVRRGEYNLNELVKWAEEEIKIIDDLFDKSDLPETIDNDLLKNILLTIRKEFYGI
jgi:predicted nucleotidyltransferase